MGYHRAGFDVVGVDINPQPHYPFEFIQGDALDVLSCWDFHDGACWADIAAIHASPPCQAYSVLAQSHRNAGKVYLDLLGPTRKLLEETGLPWVIENVPNAPMRADYILCGSMFNMNVWRHRQFECSWRPSDSSPACAHSGRPVVVSGNNHSGGFTAAQIKDAMKMPWAKTRYEVRQAIPPAYTEWIGERLLPMTQTALP